MARMNISIPDALKSEMDALTWVNWSALAAEVFEREVRKSRKVDAMNSQQVVERLRASYEENVAAEREYGHSEGVDWASKYAEAAQLIWMESDGAAADLHNWDVRDTPFEDLEQNEFWESISRLLADPSLAFVEGFVEGALEVWERVKDEVTK